MAVAATTLMEQLAGIQKSASRQSPLLKPITKLTQNGDQFYFVLRAYVCAGVHMMFVHAGVHMCVHAGVHMCV